MKKRHFNTFLEVIFRVILRCKQVFWKRKKSVVT